MQAILYSRHGPKLFGKEIKLMVPGTATNFLTNFIIFFNYSENVRLDQNNFLE